MIIPTRDLCPVTADLYMNGQSESVCIICHGFKGHSKWGFLPYVAGKLAQAGVASLAIDFSHNGAVAGRGLPDIQVRNKSLTPHMDSELFHRNTLSREVSDLGCVIEFVMNGGLDDFFTEAPSIGLFGHSRGGISAILNAVEFDNIGAISTWSTPVHPDVFTYEQKQKWRAQGALEFSDSRTGTQLSVGISYLDDLEANRRRFDMKKAVGMLKPPHLIVHGSGDVPIPADSAVQLFRLEKHLTNRRLLLVKSGHTFGINDNRKQAGLALVQAAKETAAWFARFLNQKEK